MAWQTLMNGLTADFRGVLGNKLVGIYIHGSIGFGCFRWEVSDVDFLAVVNAPLEHTEKVDLIRAILARTPDAPPKGIEMSVVTLDACQTFVHPAPYELHFSNAHLDRYLADIDGYCEQLRGCDYDLAAHFAVVNTCGIAWYGRPIAEVFAPVPRAAVLDSILRDAADAEDGLADNTVYYILNLCRALAFCSQNLMLSKRTGAEWALQTLPPEDHPVIASALSAYVVGVGGTDSHSLPRLDDGVHAAGVAARLRRCISDLTSPKPDNPARH